MFVIFRPEAANGWISTKFGIRGLLADVINCAEFFVNLFRGNTLPPKMELAIGLRKQC